MRFNLTLSLIICYTLSFGQGNGLYSFTGKNNKYGFMDQYGNVKIKPAYIIVTNFFNDRCFVSKKLASKGYQWLCIDTVGNMIFEVKDGLAKTNFSEGIARMGNATEQWFVDKNGNKLFNKTWPDGYENFRNGVAYVSDVKGGDTFYPIDTKGDRIGTATYTKLEIYQKRKASDLNASDQSAPGDGLMKFKQDSLWGFKNRQGDIVIKPQYYLADDFKYGICAVRAKRPPLLFATDRYFDTIINTKGEIVNQLPMHNYGGFRGELIVYYDGTGYLGGARYLNKNGQKVVPKE